MPSVGQRSFAMLMMWRLALMMERSSSNSGHLPGSAYTVWASTADGWEKLGNIFLATEGN